MANYYVANSGSGGSDANSGLAGFPWETIGKVNSFSFSTADNVYFNKGNTFSDAILSVDWSGTSSGSESTIGAYGAGADPMFSYATTAEQFTTASGIDHLIFEDLNAQNTSASPAAGERIFNFSVAGVCENYTVQRCTIATKGKGVYFAKDITTMVVQDNTITAKSHGIHVNAQDAAVTLQPKDILIDNNTVTGEGTSSSDCIVIHNSEPDNTPVEGNPLIITNNVCSLADENGIDVGSAVIGSFNVEFNTVFDCDKPQMTIGHGNRGGTVQRNIIHDTPSTVATGQQMSIGGSVNTEPKVDGLLIKANLIYGDAPASQRDGIYISQYIQNSSIIENLIDLNGNTGGTSAIIRTTSTSIPSEPPTWAVGEDKQLSHYVIPTTPNGFHYECTTPGTTDGATEPTWPTTLGLTVNDNGLVWTCRNTAHIKSMVIKGNILLGPASSPTVHFLRWASQSIQPDNGEFDIDYNWYYGRTGAQQFRIVDSGGTNQYYTFASWKSTFSQDANSTEGIDPLQVDPAANDYHLTSSSGPDGDGVDLTGITNNDGNDYDEVSYDTPPAIGPFEYKVAGSAPIFVNHLNSLHNG